ncbi:MAG: aminoglycoside phosphotransferase family protein [Kiritimatiellae bacterium]|nr:aminoglycoside phosphotransferase family protein [Kiritimatiellia bacterium]
MDLSILVNKFNVKGRLVALQPFGNGNINDTFLAIYRNTFTETQVVLQRVNRSVFPHPEVIMENMHEVTRHCHEKLSADAQEGRDDRVWQMPRIIKTKEGRDYVTDEKGEVWRVITRIMSAHAFDVAQGPEHALECGATLGHFHYLVSDMNPAAIRDPLPGFHITSGYLAAYDRTLETHRAKDLLGSSMEAKRLSKFIEERRGLALALETAEKNGELRKRMFHGDPKVNNIMIDDVTGKGTAMIDLDTVSPGLIHLDFGDALRSICNPAGEEETNLSKVVFDEDLCTAFCKGYMKEAGAFLTDADRAYLYDSIRLLPFELGLRFFQDYLAGNVYFRTTQPEQNLNRARVQFRLCESVEARERSIRDLLAKL